MKIKLPSGETVVGANGAAFAQRGQSVTFTPADGAAPVPGGGTVRFTFDVSSLLSGDPTECTIDDRPCS